MDSFDRISFYAKQNIPCIFIIDFDALKPVIIPICEVNPKEILYNFNGITNQNSLKVQNTGNIILNKIPATPEKYAEAFNFIQQNQTDGNSYLANLTFPNEISIKHTLKDIFYLSRAKYKLCYLDQFVVFSPETFVKIENNKISSYPMKGTIDASIPDAESIILSDEKEMAEHLTIVDLIRNDLSMVAEDVSVKKYSYVETIFTQGKNLLQVSSEITGVLKSDYRNHLGQILKTLLPAGSVTGAPKHKTVEIIKKAENYERGYYTGICGYFDGTSLDSGVMIRFIERDNGGYVFKSGGGITVYSELLSEYQEMVDKINVPTD